MPAQARLLAVLVAVVAAASGCDDGPERRDAPVRTPTPAATAAVAPAAPGLAVGVTEPNPSLIWPDRAVPAPFGRWRDALAAIKPSYYRLHVVWSALQPDAAAPANFTLPQGGCLRAEPPCSGWAGVREQLQALAARQAGGGWDGMIVISGTPEWAASPPAGGCEPPGASAQARPPRADALAAYARFVVALAQEARAAGARVPYWSPWNEPNHPGFLAPQRSGCDPAADTRAVAPYVELARTMRSALARAPGEQTLVLGELAGLLDRRPRSTTVGEFVAALPADLVCSTTVWGQHAYVSGPEGGDDPVAAVASALDAFGCPRAHAIWITETGVGGPRAGAERAAAATEEASGCEALAARLARWYANPRVTAAFQYTLREDDRFPVGLVTTDLRRAYPVLGLWTAWGAARRPDPASPPPDRPCPTPE